MNVCILSGRLTWQPELRYQPNGKPELSLRLSVPNGERDGKRFFLPFDVTVYGQSCEILAECLEPDDLVELTGQTTWPKPSRKPGGKPIPAVICFGVTKLSGSASGGHEADAEDPHEGGDMASMVETSEPVREQKVRRPRVPKIAQRPWTPAGLVSSEN
jgi:single-stranded DNA-binding protein